MNKKIVVGMVGVCLLVLGVAGAGATTTTFYTTSSDGYVKNPSDTYYDTVHDAASGTVYGTATTIFFGQEKIDTNMYAIRRAFLFFDTSSIPSGASITSANLSLYIDLDQSSTDFDMVIQNGQPTYPHDPLESGDFNMNHYSGNGGYMNTNGIVVDTYNNITLNETGRGWIQKDGTTKLCLRNSKDINDVAPTGTENIRFFTYENAANYKPRLIVTYTPPPCTAPTISSLTNSTPGTTNVTITWSTNQSADNKVKYSKNSDLTSSSWSSWDNDTTSVSIDITSLDSGTPYYYQAWSYNGTNATCYITEPTSQPYKNFTTSSGPYHITNCTQLQNMSDDLLGDYIVDNDIDCSDTINWNAGAGFVPIGNGSDHFNGTFDGQNYTISDLYINRQSDRHQGLFNYTESASIVKNIGLVNINITGFGINGGIAAFVYGSVSNSYTTGIIQTGDCVCGGIAGNCYGKIEYCNSSCIIRQRDGQDASFLGGLVGVLYGDGFINESYATGNVGNPNVPDIGEYVGGFVGRCYGKINNCYATGNASGAQPPDSGTNVGGFTGKNSGTINNSYSIGIPSGTSSIGGFAGTDIGTIEHCYYDTNTSGYSDTGKGEPKTTTEMQTQSTFINWDFINVWCMSGYPELFWSYESTTCTTPTISSLTNSTPGLNNVTITWNTNQSADSIVKYSKNSDLSSEEWSIWDNDTSSISIGLTGLDSNTQYFYQAQSYNGTNNSCLKTEPVSEPYKNFTTQASGDTCSTPTISSLTNSTPTIDSVTITWTTNQSADNRVKYSNNSDLSDHLWSNWHNDTSSISIGLSGLDDNTTYYYQAWSYNGTNSSCLITEPVSSPYKNFTTAEYSAPNKPTNPSPANESTDASLSPTLSWTGGGEGTVTYTVWFGTSLTKVSDNQTGTTYGTGSLLRNTTYQWQIVAYSDYGSNSSDVWHFTTNDYKLLEFEGLTDVWDTYFGNSDVEVNTSSLTNMTIDTWSQNLGGSVFWLLIFVLVFLAIFIAQEHTLLLSMAGILMASSLFLFMPAEFMPAALAVMVLSIGGILYSFYKGRT